MSLESFFTRFNITRRLAIGFALTIVVALSLCGATIYTLTSHSIEQNINLELKNTASAMANMVRAAVDVSVRNHLRAIAEKNLDIVKALYNEAKAGKITEKQARETARLILLSQEIGRTGYIYVLNSKGRVLIHPKKNMPGQDVSRIPFVKSQIRDKNGYIEYEWANPGETEPRPKALYMAYFKPWDWIISASSYRKEFETLVNVDDFRDKILDIKLGQTGYVFIIDRTGETLAHPWVTNNIKNYKQILGNEFFNDIYRLKQGRLSYQWKDRHNDKLRNKVAVFEYLPEMGWIVAASMYTDEIYAPLNSIVHVTLGAIALSVLFVLPLAFGMSRSITRPVNKLVTLFRRAANGDLDARSDDESTDEIGTLSRRFNLFMDDLQQSECALVAEVEVRKESEYRRKLFEEVFANALEGITITDTDGNIIAANPAFTTITGYEEEEVLGQNPNVLKSNRHETDFYKDMWSKLAEDGHWSGEIWNRRKNGESFPEILSISAIRDEEGTTTNYVAVFHDITEMKSKEELIHYQEHYDALTGLPNRALLMDRIGTAITHARRHDSKAAVFYLDLDNFKTINDSLGHALGDKLLQRTTARITKVIGEQDTLSRLGGDEFVILLEDFTDERLLVRLAKRLITAFASPFNIDGHEIYVTTSLGITVFPDDADDPGTLIKNADMAMYQAKADGRNRYHMFRKSMHERMEKRFELETAIRQAVRNEEFVVYYQPKVNLADGRISGMEALVRWIRPDGQVVSPADFIPLAEETGFIVNIGQTVLENACLDLRYIREKTGHNPVISINLSARQFQEADLLTSVNSIVDVCQADPASLEFEITESVLMEDVNLAVGVLNDLAKMGFAISVDDFGTGYSSLAYLKYFPINTLKIDRSFVKDITTNPDDAQIVQAVIGMCRNLGLDVVAEGVETEEQADMLRSYDCQKAQGFLYAKPMPLAELVEFLKSYQA